MLRTKSRQAIAELKEELFIEVYNKVAKKIIEETEKKQKNINDSLVKRLENFDIMLDKAIKEKLTNELKLLERGKGD